MSTADQGLTIGVVLAQLQADFPGLTISKLRYLDAQGLVSPARTPSGYRRYSKRDVQRLHYVLTCQRDRFWPLKVIREALDAFDRGLEPAGPTSARPQAPAPRDDEDLPAVGDLERSAEKLELTGDELARAAGVGRGTIADLESYGLIHADEQGHYGWGSLQVARAAADLLSYGIQARHLRPFRLAADRELGLAEQLSATQGSPGHAAVIRQCLALHLALVRAGTDAG